MSADFALAWDCDWDWNWTCSREEAWRFKGAKGFYVRPNRGLFALLDSAERGVATRTLALRSVRAERRLHKK